MIRENFHDGAEPPWLLSPLIPTRNPALPAFGLVMRLSATRPQKSLGRYQSVHSALTEAPRSDSARTRQGLIMIRGAGRDVCRPSLAHRIADMGAVKTVSEDFILRSLRLLCVQCSNTELSNHLRYCFC